MSEFCKQCAEDHGMENDEPCFCEGCGYELLFSMVF